MNDTEQGQKMQLGRRTLMRWFLGIGAVSSLSAMGSVLATIRPSEEELGANAIQAGDPLVFALGNNKGQPILLDSILVGQGTLAFPEGKEMQDNLLFVYRDDPQVFKEPTRLDWVAQGYVAYSAICTHLGCTVNYSHEAMDGIASPHAMCPCHGGVFDPQTGGRVVTGPAPRSLPQLPIAIDEQGAVVAAGPFEEPTGVI